MKKKILYLFLIILLAFGTVGCGKKEDNTIYETDSIETKVEKTIRKMTLDEKIAQMLILHYESDKVDDNLQSVLDEVKPGGFIIGAKNITTYEKTKMYIDTLKASSDIPMIISIDQEGGIVQRLRGLYDYKSTNIPSMYYVGKTNDTDLAYNIGKIIAEESRTLGINVVYNPVCDIYSNPDNTVIGYRSFGTTPEVVSKMSESVAKGMEENGVIATYKHFPGHGDTAVDSHKSLPIINKTLEELENFELIPFKNAIENDAKIIMIGHLAVPKVTGDDIPASLSKVVITDILKKKMGYKGLVITDAMNMGALTNHYSDEDIYVKSIEAGVDLLLMPNGSRNAISYIKDKVSEDRIDESVRKILTFKFTYLDDYKELDKSYLNSKEHQEIVSKVNTTFE